MNKDIDVALNKLMEEKFPDAYVVLGKLNDLRKQQQDLTEKLQEIILNAMDEILMETKKGFNVDVDATINENALNLRRGSFNLKVAPDFGSKTWEITGNLSDVFVRKHGKLPLSEDVTKPLVEFFNQRYERK